MRARRTIEIQGGTVRGFESGIFVAQSANVLITGNRFTENREGVFSPARATA